MGTIATLTIGSTTYSVYALTSNALTDAKNYFAAKFGSTWSTATTLQQRQLLISAARWGDRAVKYAGTKTVATQALEWPRDDAFNQCTQLSVADGTVPDEIAIGHFELAGALFLKAKLQDGTGTGSNVKLAKGGSAQVQFFTPTINGANDNRLPQAAHDELKCFFGSQISVQVAVASGTDVASCFDPNDFDRTGGF